MQGTQGAAEPGLSKVCLQSPVWRLWGAKGAGALPRARHRWLVACLALPRGLYRAGTTRVRPA